MIAFENIFVKMLSKEPPVRYIRQGELIANPRAKLGHTHASTVDSAGFPLHIRFADFLLMTADTPQGFIPQVGDIIQTANRAYIVSAVEGEPCWRYHTRQSSEIIRVHTKEIPPTHPALILAT